MAGIQTPSQDTPQGPISPSGPATPSTGSTTRDLVWTHVESDPMKIGPAALETARLGSWDSLDAVTRTRHLRAFVVMSLQAATTHNEPQILGKLSAASFPDDDHNAAGAAVARTLLLLAPRRPMLLSQSMLTTDGAPAILSQDPGTGLGWMAIVAIGAACAAAGAALGWFGSSSTADKSDAADFREQKTKVLVSTQAAAIDVLAKHAEREKLAGKPLPFTEEERRLLSSLEDTQRAIAAERRQPLASPFEGAKSFTEILKGATGFLEALLPLAIAGGALYLVSRFGGDSPPPARQHAAELPGHDSQKTITLTRNKEGVYEQEEDHGQG